MCRHNPIDLQDLPDRLVLLNEQYALARYHPITLPLGRLK